MPLHQCLLFVLSVLKVCHAVCRQAYGDKSCVVNEIPSMADFVLRQMLET
jgi:hypothetical protein